MEDETGVIEYQVDDIIDFERRIANVSCEIFEEARCKIYILLINIFSSPE